MLALPAAFDVLKIAGAAYLVYLGIQAWRAPVEPDATPQPSGASTVALLRDGFLVGISNPKLLIFAAAFFPQFIDPARAWGPQFALMVATFVGVELFFYSIYALGGRKLADRLMHGIWRRRLNRPAAWSSSASASPCCATSREGYCRTFSTVSRWLRPSRAVQEIDWPSASPISAAPTGVITESLCSSLSSSTG